MIKKSIVILSLLTIIVACQKKEQDPFLISNQNIGMLTDSTKVKDLSSLFINDSISKYIGGDEFTGDINDIEIFEKKSGKLLMVLTPFEALDSTSAIKTIRIVDPRFKTIKGLNVNSTFKDVIDNYKITNIQNTLSNLIVSLDDINAFFTIDKKELPADMRYDMSLKFEAIQIPDQAKIKHFMISWY